MRKFFILTLIMASFFGVRAQAPGTLDETFGNGGLSIFDATGSGKGDQVHDIMALSDGKILVAGPAQNSGNQFFTVVRYNEDGTLDATFGNNGVVSFNPTGFYGNFPKEIALTNDGAYLIGGYVYNPNGSPSTNYILVKLNTDGSFDANFGNNGVVIGPSTQNPVFQISTMKIDAEGKIFAAGFVNDPDKAAIMKFNEDGSVDTSFGNNGVAVYDGYEISAAEDICLQEDGKILIGGMWVGDGHNIAFFARFNANGTLDTAFGNNGGVELTVGNYYTGQSFTTAIDVDKEGNVVAAGHFWVANEPLQYDIFVTRYDNNGVLDTSFGNNGINILRPTQGASNYISDMVVASDSTIYLSGRICVYYTTFDFLALGLDKNGALNANFANNGIFIYHDPANLEVDAAAIDITYDNKLVIGGSHSDSNYYYDFMVARIYSDITIYEALADNEYVGFNIYPNPTSEFVNITLNNDLTYKAEIVDMNGRVVMMSNVCNGSSLDISTLNAGNYFIVITNGADQKVARISKK